MSGEYVAGNRIELLETGSEYFPALLAAIEGARREILLEVYIFEPDRTGEVIAEALKQAAARGVRVRLVVDGFGGRLFSRSVMPQLLEAGVEVLLYRRELRLLSFRRNRLRRLHRKLSVFDGELAFVGGINIIDDMHTPGHTPPRFDYAVSIRGPLVSQIHRPMATLWRMMCWVEAKRRPKEMHWCKPVVRTAGAMRAAFVLRDNFRHRSDIEDAYLEALESARHTVILANAYFFPGRRFRHALVRAAQRGVKVTLLLQGKVEYWLLHHACRALYPHLLARGVQIVEYRKSFLHAKVAVIDDDWATVGSSNIDPFSLLLAREANVIVRERAFTKELRESLEQAIESGGVPLTQVDWHRQPRMARFASWMAYGCVRWVLGVLGFGRQH
jgi:cardiolipin synthase A/B